jgi:hypothetical protein
MVGLRPRREVVALGLPALIGKEANELEAVCVGLVETEVEVLNRYPDPEHSIWSELVRPELADMPPGFIGASVDPSPRALHTLRRGRAQPRRDHAPALVWAAVTFARARLAAWGVTVQPSAEPLPAVSMAQGRIPRQALATLTRYREEAGCGKRRCASCGGHLADRTGRRRYCSSACRWRAWRNGHPELRRRVTFRRRSRLTL